MHFASATVLVELHASCFSDTPVQYYTFDVVFNLRWSRCWGPNKGMLEFEEWAGTHNAEAGWTEIGYGAKARII